MYSKILQVIVHSVQYYGTVKLKKKKVVEIPCVDNVDNTGTVSYVCMNCPLAASACCRVANRGRFVSVKSMKLYVR